MKDSFRDFLTAITTNREAAQHLAYLLFSQIFSCMITNVWPAIIFAFIVAETWDACLREGFALCYVITLKNNQRKLRKILIPRLELF
jgi:hypothetical protein